MPKGLLGRIDLLALFAAALTLAAPVHARDQVSNQAITLKAGRLADSLRELSTRSGTGLLFDPGVVRDRRNQRVSASGVDEALRLLLEGSGLSFRRTAAGTIVIFLAPAPVQQELAVPEILVVGRRTQNADIRRTENDIQPYQVATSREIMASHADNLDQFLRTRLSSNTVLLGPSQDPASQLGNNRSEINLHGIGTNQTLVLVDGARMPGVPEVAAPLTMDQPDVNGIPLASIDRIEAITATAGGIYGPGATGGVINVILKRDYRGADLALTYGLSTKGDAPHRRIDARLGFTPDHGRTDVMLMFSQTASRRLPLGDRDFATKARQILIARDPTGFLANFPTADAVLVRTFGENLSLAPSLGGAQLGSSFTYLPIGTTRSVSDLGATLLANAGRVPSALAPDGSGTRRSLTNQTRVTSLLFNLRHHFSEDVEAFVDLLGYQNNGSAVTTLTNPSVVASFAPTNPFAQTVIVLFPMKGFDGTGQFRLRTFRLSTGLIIRLPLHWKADANYSLGAVREEVSDSAYLIDSDASIAIGLGRPLVAGGKPLNPFGDWNEFAEALQAHKSPVELSLRTHEHFRDASLRLAGPILSKLTLSLLAEHRYEVVPSSTQETIVPGLKGTQVRRGFSQTVSSLYAEARAPLVSRASGPRLLRGLELQLAARYDDNKSRLPTGANDWLTAHQAATAFTAGFRVYPEDHLMLRASIATGILPPTPNQLAPLSNLITFPFGGIGDPKRGGRVVGSEAPFTLLEGGTLKLQPERARSLSFGMVLNPDGGQLPRISIDFTHLAKTNEITTAFAGSVAYFVANEGLYPDRVTRAQLTPADTAAGFTGGVITQVDANYLNVGRTWSDAIDFRADHNFELGPGGHLKLYAAATWQPFLKRRISPDQPKVEFVGFADGPLRWRGNGGFEWDKSSLSIDLNGQYYAPYHAISVANGSIPAAPDPKLIDEPGVRIPAQFYLDISAAYRLRLASARLQNIVLRLGIVNLLDHKPPISTNTNLGYSFYGDPRGRRFEASLLTHF